MRLTDTTSEMLGKLRMSESTLLRLRGEGVLKPGTHYRATGMGTVRSPLAWDPSATEEALANRTRRTRKAG